MLRELDTHSGRVGSVGNYYYSILRMAVEQIIQVGDLAAQSV